MTNKKVRVFAGPNGSGKPTLIAQIDEQFNLGYIINADVIKKQGLKLICIFYVLKTLKLINAGF